MGRREAGDGGTVFIEPKLWLQVDWPLCPRIQESGDAQQHAQIWVWTNGGFRQCSWLQRLVERWAGSIWEGVWSQRTSRWRGPTGCAAAHCVHLDPRKLVSSISDWRFSAIFWQHLISCSPAPVFNHNVFGSDVPGARTMWESRIVWDHQTNSFLLRKEAKDFKCFWKVHCATANFKRCWSAIWLAMLKSWQLRYPAFLSMFFWLYKLDSLNLSRTFLCIFIFERLSLDSAGRCWIYDWSRPWLEKERISSWTSCFTWVSTHWTALRTFATRKTELAENFWTCGSTRRSPSVGWRLTTAPQLSLMQTLILYNLFFRVWKNSQPNVVFPSLIGSKSVTSTWI